ncbi:tyrosine-type recombinase/integrase [Streptomyces niveus]|uniref:tyrosine-type recombinase/integrase n=1 Tax=Streptomyces niveus TaxID=193462 RepID=UPI003836774F
MARRRPHLTHSPKRLRHHLLPAYDLRDFFVWLGQTGLDFRHSRLEVFVLPGVGQALENTTPQRKRAAFASFYRFHARRDESLPTLLGNLLVRRPTGSCTPMLARRLMGACNWRRDRFLIALLDEAGLRISEALGLRHADSNLRKGEAHVVPRERNVNRARVKGMKGRNVPVRPELFDRYAADMETEYGTLDCDFVFANLFRAPAEADRHHALLAACLPAHLRHPTAAGRGADLTRKRESAHGEIRRLRTLSARPSSTEIGPCRRRLSWRQEPLRLDCGRGWKASTGD